MEIKLFKNEEIMRLKNDFDNNIENDRYSRLGFESYIDKSNVVSLKNTHFDEELFSTLINEIGGDKDAFNAKIIYKSLEGLTPYNARDGRLWTYLAHTSGFRFSLVRTTNIEDLQKRKEKVLSEFFLEGGNARDFQSRHNLSKLWWAAYLCSLSELPFEQALEVFCKDSDFRASVIEHPNTYFEPAVFSALLNVAQKRWDGSESPPFFRRKKNKSPYREMHKEVNRHGGAKMLSLMNRDALEHLLEECAVKGEENFKAHFSIT